MILETVRKIIAEKRLKQKDICEALNLSQSYTSELLSGKKEFSLSMFEKLCDFLEIEIQFIDKNRY